jgi:CBS domain-containing protein
MVPNRELASVSPSNTLVQAFEALDEHGVNQLPVVEEGVLVGMLSREDLLRLISSHLELQGPLDRKEAFRA